MLAVGCGSGPGEGELVDAVDGYSVAFTSGDAETAYGMLSDRCQGRVAESEFAAVVEVASSSYGETAPETVEVGQLEGDMARVTYTFADPALDQESEPWVVEDGAWRQDDC